MTDIKLTDLIDVETLQEIQDGFADMLGIAALTTDARGVEVTEGSNFTDYCMNSIRTSAKGREQCRNCDRYGAEKTMETGKSIAYTCHSGLVDFAAPIIADGKMVGSFIGGQVLCEEPDKDKIRAIAEDYDLDFDKLWEDISKVPVIPKEKVDKAARFLSVMATTLSNMAYGKNMAIRANEEIMSAANMKSNFLANMSHEIRTPMNAVIGMAEMALREELSPNARKYITQIKSSGRALLNIINDILDYSKIESGKMDIINENYEPLSLFSDSINVIMAKTKDNTDLELLMSMNPALPKFLYGDSLRIRQILINLANNAVKFTRKGYVDIKVDFEKTGEDSINLLVKVKDTGIGIKKDDIQKLFSSFEQVDSKRNRNVEGTGLGLAISKNLLNLMGGSISVESEYEKGSIFSFVLPQKVLDWNPSVAIEKRDDVVSCGFWTDEALARHFLNDTKALGVFSLNLSGLERFDDVYEAYSDKVLDKKIFFFFDEKDYNDELKSIIDSYSNVTGVMLTGFYSEADKKIGDSNIRIVNKPLSTLCVSMALNNLEIADVADESESFKINFTAPRASVLIVDDNDINLTVAEGLLEPLGMKLYTATGGKQAIKLLDENVFDLVFMDHMMPEMDGIETTRNIRSLYPQYAKMPIIALTANAMEGTKEHFLSEGMNDFVAKPIEMNALISVVRKWLPAEKIIENTGVVNAEEPLAEGELKIGDLDTAAARKLLGSDKLYFNILKEYYRNIPGKSEAINKHYHDKNWPEYTIEVHALKSTSKQIGAMKLSSLAADLEKAGNLKDEELISMLTDSMLEIYRNYIDILRPFCEEQADNKAGSGYDADAVMGLLDEMKEAFENLDMDTMENVMDKMKKYNYPDDQKKLCESLKIAVDSIDIEGGTGIIENWRKII